jgi:HEPN domain-containing protein
MPSLSEVYREIAERHLVAARAVLDRGLPDIAAFHCYHAFESIACAAIALRSRDIPRRHDAKLHRFVALSRGLPFSFGATTLAQIMNPTRSLSLYPTISASIASPREAFDISTAENLLRRVEGFLAAVIATLRL